MQVITVPVTTFKAFLVPMNGQPAIGAPMCFMTEQFRAAKRTLFTTIWASNSEISAIRGGEFSDRFISKIFWEVISRKLMLTRTTKTFLRDREKAPQTFDMIEVIFIAKHTRSEMSPRLWGDALFADTTSCIGVVAFWATFCAAANSVSACRAFHQLFGLTSHDQTSLQAR